MVVRGRSEPCSEECKGILKGCTEEMGSMPPIMPSPGGGMTMEKAGTV